MSLPKILNIHRIHTYTHLYGSGQPYAYEMLVAHLGPHLSLSHLLLRLNLQERGIRNSLQRCGGSDADSNK